MAWLSMFVHLAQFMKKNERILRDITSFLKKYFKNRKYFSCVYGSFSRHKRSDIDLFVAIKNGIPMDLKILKRFIIKIHKENNIPLDYEVPFENKLIISQVDIERAVNLKGFQIKNNKFVIPKVKKTNFFLSSYPIKLRLVLNALSGYNIFLGGDRKWYDHCSRLAKRNILILGLDLLGEPTFSIDLIIEKLFTGKDGEKGEYYLGYKRNPSMVKYLKKMISEEMNKMVRCAQIKKLAGNRYVLRDFKIISNLKKYEPRIR